MEIKHINQDYWIDKNGYIYARVRVGAKGGVVKQWIDGGGYYNVRLTIGGKTSNHKVHRLYAQAFIPNPKKLPFINHIDGNKLNNRLDNLEWCTQSENMEYAHRTGLIPSKSTTGYKYVYWEKKTKSWRVIISQNKTKIRLGRFDSLMEAVGVRDKYLKSRRPVR